ncbi:MAG TPA: ATP-binding protein, partial [Bacteroidales bacterium]|nr:ATP-binding protein [Bacteroidales bacterium]HPT03732.1 ATP-binding protein [Bacteroidales bacterium]
LCSANPEINFVYRHITESGEYIFDSREIKETLEGVSISNPDIMKYLKEMIKENLLEINTNN